MTFPDHPVPLPHRRSPHTAPRRRSAAGILAAVVLAGAAAVGCSSSSPSSAPPSPPPSSSADTARQEQVARNGAAVMPFDLDRTTHRFIPGPDGLLQEVVSDAPLDAEQIRLIREHLTSEADRFRRGDYADPASIHGTAMPGLHELTAGAPRIEISYAERPDGAALTFRTTDPQLTDALHRWGAAQISDHGDHAEH